MIIEFLKAVLYGIVEGITEWLPVSSTGHLILLNEFIGLDAAPAAGEVFRAEFWEMFEVVIQLGAILAVVVMFFGKLNPFSGKKSQDERVSTWKMWLKVLVASIPAAIAGTLLDKIIEAVSGKDIDGWLYNAWVVAAALIVYGVLFIIIERRHAGKEPLITDIDGISYKNAFLIGVFQMLSIIPGTSRSGSTILGSMLLGLSRTTAAEFSFFMAIPAMAGASLLKGAGFVKYIAENDVTVPAGAWLILLTASVVAFAVSIAAIRFLTDFVKKHSFSAFGVYRIVLGIVVIIYFLTVYAG